MKKCLFSFCLLLGAIHAAKKAAKKTSTPTVYTRDEFLKFYQEQFEKYSPDGILSLVFSPDKGFHTVANRELSIGEPVIEVPCSYAIGVCKK